MSSVQTLPVARCLEEAPGPTPRIVPTSRLDSLVVYYSEDRYDARSDGRKKTERHVA